MSKKKKYYFIIRLMNLLLALLVGFLLGITVSLIIIYVAMKYIEYKLQLDITNYINETSTEAPSEDGSV